MEIKIGLPLSFSEIGQKDNQEDFVFPSPNDVKQTDRIFILCDGMGGHSHGEVASSTVATSLGQYMKWHFPSEGLLTKELFVEGLNYAYGQLNMVDDGSPKKMGTTLTFVGFHKEGCFCAHIGDSRIYIVRPSEKRIIYRSEDHSLVNDLVRSGELTPEEAATYPHKNVITRAMQPNQEKPAKAEMRNITDIKSGDYVFLCCDGILENLSDDKLVDILSNPGLNDVRKLAEIKDVCLGRTKDNFTCYLIPVQSVTGEVVDYKGIQPILSDSQESENDVLDVPQESYSKKNSFLSRRFSFTAPVWVWLSIIIALLLLFFLFAHKSPTRSMKGDQNIESIENTIEQDNQSGLRTDNDGSSSRKSFFQSRKKTNKDNNQQQWN